MRLNKTISLLLLVLPCMAYSQGSKLDSLLNELQHQKDDTAKVLTFRKAAQAQMPTDPLKSVELAGKGIALGKKLGFDSGVAYCYVSYSFGYAKAAMLDSAIKYIDTAIAWAKKANDLDRLAHAHGNKGDILTQLSNYNDALRNCQLAIHYALLAKKDSRLASGYLGVGNIYVYQKNYEQALGYYQKALPLFEKNGPSLMHTTVLCNIGICLKHLKQYHNSISYINRAISISDSLKETINLWNFYGNISEVYYLAGNAKMAESAALNCLRYSQLNKNDIQVGYAWNFIGDVYFKTEKYKQAIEAFTKGYEFAQRTNMLDQKKDAVFYLAEANEKLGNYQEGYKYLKLKNEYGDSLSKKQFNSELAGLQTTMRLSEKEKEIQILAKENEIKKEKLSRQYVYLTGLVIITILALIGIWLAINRYKLRQRLKEIEIRNQIAADLHDEVGSSLSSIHMLSQMITTTETNGNQKNIMDKVGSNAKETMDRMSDIVWMIKPGETDAGSLKQRMERFANEISGAKNIKVSTDLSAIDTIKFSMAQRKNIYLVFKEAINNAAKYSGSEEIEVKATIENRQIKLLIKDYGKGFDKALTGRGNGLDNMKNRAKESGGTLAIDSTFNEGTSVTLSVPV